MPARAARADAAGLRSAHHHPRPRSAAARPRLRPGVLATQYGHAAAQLVAARASSTRRGARAIASRACRWPTWPAAAATCRLITLCCALPPTPASRSAAEARRAVWRRAGPGAGPTRSPARQTGQNSSAPPSANWRRASATTRMPARLVPRAARGSRRRRWQVRPQLRPQLGAMASAGAAARGRDDAPAALRSRGSRPCPRPCGRVGRQGAVDCHQHRRVPAFAGVLRQRGCASAACFRGRRRRQPAGDGEVGDRRRRHRSTGRWRARVGSDPAALGRERRVVGVDQVFGSEAASAQRADSGRPSSTRPSARRRTRSADTAPCTTPPRCSWPSAWPSA